MEAFISLQGWQQALLATLFTWLMTAIGSSVVFFCKNVNEKAFCFMMSAAAGIMLASTFYSLLLPATLYDDVNVLLIALWFCLGGLLIVMTDIVVNAITKGSKKCSCAVMCIAVTMHNIPEGLAIGVAFGAITGGSSSLVAALMLALGIGIQNLPEGMCVSCPLKLNGMSRFSSFFIGQLSGAVEIVAGVIGAVLASSVVSMLPCALTFSGGAMIAVVCSELIPESFKDDKIKATVGVVLGFALMMFLDLAFG